MQLLHWFYLCWFNCFFIYFFFFFFLSDYVLNTIGFYSIEQLYCRLLYKVTLYGSWYVLVVFAHIYTCMLLHIYLWYTYYICTVDFVYIVMILLSTIFVFCCLSPILCIVNLITMEILGIYNRWNDMVLL